MRGSNCLPFKSPWVHPRFLVGCVALIIFIFCVVLCFVCLFLSFVVVFFSWVCISFLFCFVCVLCLVGSQLPVSLDCLFQSWLPLLFSLTFIGIKMLIESYDTGRTIVTLLPNECPLKIFEIALWILRSHSCHIIMSMAVS